MSASDANALLIGAGGHARVCLEALSDAHPDLVFVAVSLDGSAIHGLEVAMLGTTDKLEYLADSGRFTTAHVAIGNNAARQNGAERWLTAGGTLSNAISRYAMPSRSALWESGVALLPGAVVNAGTRLGCCVIVNTNASLDHDCEVGSFSHVGPGTVIAGGVIIGKRVLIGVGARVLPNLRIGDDVIVGAGAVVTSDVPSGTVVVGIPARAVDR